MKTYTDPVDIIQRIQAITSKYWPEIQPPMAGTIIKDYFKSANIDEYVWLLVNVALEIDCKIYIPDEVAGSYGQTFSEFATQLSMIKPNKDKTWTFNRLKLIADSALFELPYQP